MFRTSLLVAAAISLPAANRPDSNSDIRQAKAQKVAPEPEAVELSGYYTCKGQETGGKTYSGVVVITKKNEIYLIQWNCAGSSFLGIGIRQGNTLAASWTIPGDGKGMVRGVNMYKIEAGPKLIGRWASLPGNGLMQSETLTFLKKLDDEDME